MLMFESYVVLVLVWTMFIQLLTISNAKWCHGDWL